MKKNEMDLNNRKMKNHPPSPVCQRPKVQKTTLIPNLYLKKNIFGTVNNTNIKTQKNKQMKTS